MKKDTSFRDIRELRKMGLQTFFLNLENNHFENIANKSLIELEQELIKLENELKSKVNQGNYGLRLNIFFLKKELFSISEMKILYSFKHFENHLKWLIKASYNEINSKDFFRWENLENFLKSKNINIKEFLNYKEINELRLVSNSIKHSLNIINNETKHILEFRKGKELSYKDLNSFYERVEPKIMSFIQSISTEIEKDLYEFDDFRLEKLSDKIAKRMDVKTLERLIEKLDKKKNNF